MNLLYAGVQLDICHFNDFQQRDLRSEDGTDRLFTHFLIDVTCVWNHAATASLNGRVQQPAPGVLGDTPALSIATLRETLLQERQKLTVTIGDQIILQSPPTLTQAMAIDTDANNGPHPISCDVTSFRGVATAIVRFRIETWLNESDPVRLIASNRWTATENVLEDYRKIIHAEGTAVFNQSVIQANIAAVANINSADAFRFLVVPPPRNGYQRKSLRIALDSDGTRLYWSFDDHQPEGNYQLRPSSGIVKVEGYTYSQTEWSGGFFGAPGLRLPDLTEGIHIEVWGRPQTTRQQLANALIRVATSAGFGSVPLIGHHSRLQVHFPQRRAWLDYALGLSGLVGGSLAALGLLTTPDRTGRRLFADFDATGIWVQGVGPQPIISPGGDGIHGDSMPGSNAVQLLAAKLLGPGAAPLLPAINQD
jgi:hypothetical protein